MFEEGRRSIEKKEVKECTFSPNTDRQWRSTRSSSKESIDTFYERNIAWQHKKEKEIKKKQVEKNTEGTKNLTFAPKIVKLTRLREPFARRQLVVTNRINLRCTR